MLRMLSHMGIQDNQIQTDLRIKFLKNHTDDLKVLENVRYIAKSLSLSIYISYIYVCEYSTYARIYIFVNGSM